LELLDIKGSTITIDAMGCQKEIAQKILDAEADYVLSLKRNQKNTFDFVQNLFADGLQNNFQGLEYTKFETIEKDHGRIERRRIYSINVGNGVEFDELKEWPGLKSVTMVVSTREIIGKEKTVEYRYYLSSIEANAEIIGSTIRFHWGMNYFNVFSSLLPVKWRKRRISVIITHVTKEA
jgi:predicted transposase YbfD/YdcC